MSKSTHTFLPARCENPLECKPCCFPQQTSRLHLADVGNEKGRTSHQDGQIINQRGGWKIMSCHVALDLLMDFFSFVNSFILMSCKINKKKEACSKKLATYSSPVPCGGCLHPKCLTVPWLHFFPDGRNGKIIGQCWVEPTHPLSYVRHGILYILYMWTLMKCVSSLPLEMKSSKTIVLAHWGNPHHILSPCEADLEYMLASISLFTCLTCNISIYLKSGHMMNVQHLLSSYLCFVLHQILEEISGSLVAKSFAMFTV